MRVSLAISAAMFLFFSSICFAQQQNNWDEALDRYELICERCLELLESQNAGENVPKESLSSLVVQLSMLKNSLSASEGSMSASQRARFEMIRHRFASHSGKSSVVQEVPVEQIPASRKKRDVSDHPIMAPASSSVADSSSVPGGSGISSAFVEAQPTTVPASTVKEWKYISNVAEIAFPGLGYWSPAALAGSRPADASPLPEVDVETCLFVAANCSAVPLGQYGMTFGLLSGRWGAYVSARTDIFSIRVRSTYDCLASGGLLDGGMIWSNGERVDGRSCVTAGGIFRLSRYVAVYTGAGWGSYGCFVGDVDGRWARVADLSGRSVSYDAGLLLFPTDHLLVGAGVNCIGLGECSAELCLGFLFGR